MSTKVIGMRVYAVRESDESTVYLVGFGTYQGEKPIYGELRPSNADFRKAEREIRKHDEKPIDVGAVLRSKRAYLKTDEQIEEAVRAYELKHQQERQRPMEERVRDHLAQRESKPCIHLDSGFIVWGHEVLWGPEEKWERYLRDREVLQVSPAYDAKRWKDEDDRGTGTAPGREAYEKARTTWPVR